MLNMKRFLLRFLSYILFGIIVLSGLNFIYAEDMIQDQESEFLRILDEKLPGLMKKYGVPGVQIAVTDGYEIRTKSYGYADRSAKIPVTSDTIFQVGSISKTVTAWGAMRLIEEGKLDLDAPIEKYLKKWPLTETGFSSEGVTLRRILSHTAGLSLRGYAGVEDEKSLVSIEESLRGNTNGAGEVKIIYEPGSRFQYSGGGYTLLQLVIEEVSGMPFEQYMEQKILKPLGMNNSSFEWKDEFREITSKAYGVLGQRLPNYIFTEKAAAGLYTTAADLAKLQIAAMNFSGDMPAGRNVLKPDKIDLMKKRVPNTNWGLGYEIMDLPNGVIAIGHGGANRGWRARMIQLEDRNQGLVVLTNSDTGNNILIEIVALWIQQHTGALPAFYGSMLNSERIAMAIAAILALYFTITLVLFARDIKKRKRQYTLFTGGRSWKRLLRIVLPGFILLAWLIGLYAPIINGWNVAEFLPVSVKWITVMVMMNSILLLILAMFPKNNMKPILIDDSKVKEKGI